MVLVRADIFTKAHEQGIDISDTCNRALADLLGVDYRQQQLDAVPVPPPVIIAKDGGVPQGVSSSPHKPPQPPVINADDPKTPGAIAKSKKQPVRKPAPLPPAPEAPAPEKRAAKAPVKAPAAAPPGKPPKATPKKAAKGDVMKKFLAEMIVREDADNATIAKEELFQIFSRWCREQKISPVPDAKAVAVTLKTRFAFREKNACGKPCWTGLRFR
jgi:hypothetical protein